MNDDTVYLKHILESIEMVKKSVEGISKQSFMENREKQDAVTRRIEVIGEAVKNISPEFKKKHPHIAWKEISGMRDVLIHSYFSVDMDLVWNAVERDIPELKKQIKQLL